MASESLKRAIKKYHKSQKGREAIKRAQNKYMKTQKYNECKIRYLKNNSEMIKIRNRIYYYKKRLKILFPDSEKYKKTKLKLKNNINLLLNHLREKNNIKKLNYYSNIFSNIV